MKSPKKRVKKKIIIASPDVLGPIANGGVGTACAALAEKLVEAGFEVDLLFTHFGVDQATAKHWSAFYEKKGIRLHLLPPPDYEHQHGHIWVRVSYAVYEWLKTRSYDLAIFPDMYGVGYYSILARRTGAFFQKMPIVVSFLGPQVWSRENNDQLFSRIEDLTIPMLEKGSIENADVVQFATDWSRKWADGQKWKYRDSYKVLFPMKKAGPSRKTKRSGRTQEIVFFGRLEIRKGICEFLEAIELMKKNNELQNRQITLLGSEGHIDNRKTLEMIRSWEIRTGISLNRISDMQSSEAIAYLRDRNAVAVIASRSETMGYTLLECMTYGIPCVFSSIEPFQELTGHKKHPAMFQVGSASSLRKVLVSGKTFTDVFRAKKLIEATGHGWTSMVNKALAAAPPRQGIPPKISVLITHHERAHYLRDALESMFNQTLAPAEILVYDDASASREHEAVISEYQKKFAMKRVPVRLVRGKVNCGPGHARNILAKLAKSEFVLFMDDDNIAMPHEIAVFSRMQSIVGADVVTTAMLKIFNKQVDLWTPRIWTPVGFDLSASAFENQMGDANFLVNRKIFLEAGGFDASPVLYAEDMNLLVRLAKKGARMCVCPEPLFIYRVHGLNRSNKMDLRESRLRNLKAHLADTSGSDLTFLAHILLTWADEKNHAWISEPPPKVRVFDTRAKGKPVPQRFINSVPEGNIVIRAQDIRSALKLKTSEAFYLALDLESSGQSELTSADKVQHFAIQPGGNSIVLGVPGNAKKIELNIVKPALVRVSRAHLLKVPFSRTVQRLIHLGLGKTLKIAQR